MSLVFVLALALLLQALLTAPAIPWFFSPVHVWLLVVVGRARRQGPLSTAWFGLFAGVAADWVRGLPLGPTGIAGVLAAALVARISLVFELTGPLFWVVNTFVASIVTEGTVRAIYASFGAPGPHGLVGAAAAVASTALLGLVTAAFEWWWRRAFSPQARRRRALRRR